LISVSSAPMCSDGDSGAHHQSHTRVALT